jgi:hypothetical protein
MRKALLTSCTAAGMAFIGFFNLNYSSNPPVDYTGRTSANCTSCHSGSVNPSGGSLGITGTTSYYPGRTYTFRVTMTGGSRYGFEMTSVQQSSTSSGVGTFNAGTGVGVTSMSGLSYARHSSSSTTGVWDVVWTAPSSNAQNARIYLSGNAANGNFGTSGDKIYVTTHNMSALNLITYSVITDSASCNGSPDGKARITSVTGGAGSPYKFAWSANNSILADSISGLSGGSYTVTVYDADSNSAVQTFIIRQPSAIAKSVVTNPSICGDSTGSISVTASGGNGGYTYAWSNMSLASSISNLKAGAYTLIIADKKQCTDTSTHVVGISGSNIALQTSSLPEYCSNGWGQASVTQVSNNIGSFNFAWTGGGNRAYEDSLSAGTYTVTVTDSLGCSKTASITVGAVTTTNLNAQTSITPDGCGQGIGAVEVINLLGGIGAVSYKWNNGKSGIKADSLISGVYSVTITDSVLCSIVLTDTVNDQSAPVISLSTTHLLCFGDTSGEISASVVGGVMPYTFQWSNGSGDSILTKLMAGMYKLTVIDSNGCKSTDSVVVTEPTALVVDTIAEVTPEQTSCDGAAYVIPKGGTPPYTYSWSNPSASTDSMPTNLCAGINTVTITDNNGCIAAANILIGIGGSVSNANTLSTRVYPNPAGEKVFVERISADLHFAVRDISGMVISEGIVQKSNSIEMPSASGIYLLELTSGERRQVLKVIRR